MTMENDCRLCSPVNIFQGGYVFENQDTSTILDYKKKKDIKQFMSSFAHNL